MPLTIPEYDLLVEDPDTGEVTEHRLQVRNGDRLRAELEAGRQGLPPIREAPMNHTTLWLWCAAARTGLTTLPFQEWRDLVVELEPVKDVNGDLDPETVDPTTAAPSA